jgi:hypothetical protein
MRRRFCVLVVTVGEMGDSAAPHSTPPRDQAAQDSTPPQSPTSVRSGRALTRFTSLTDALRTRGNPLSIGTSARFLFRTVYLHAIPVQSDTVFDRDLRDQVRC